MQARFPQPLSHLGQEPRSHHSVIPIMRRDYVHYLVYRLGGREVRSSLERSIGLYSQGNPVSTEPIREAEDAE